MNFRTSVGLVGSVLVGMGIWAVSASAQSEALHGVLRPGAGDALSLSWRQGLPDGERTQLSIDAGVAKVERCRPACQPIGRPLLLSPGQKEQILSGLRSASLLDLRSSDEAEMTADRELRLSVPNRPQLTLQLPKSEWPLGPDGQGIAGLLDDLILKIVQAGSARPQVTVPRTIEELAELKLQLTVTTHQQPGGVLVIEHGTLSITPEEGSLPRKPRPKPTARLLSPAEQEQLLTVLRLLDFDRLEESIPVRARPAIGDDDGRLVTLHLLPASKVAPTVVLKQPRGLKRYLADWVRSPAEPVVRLLASWLLLHSPKKIE